MKLAFVVTLLISFLGSNLAFAATWVVNKEGTGDYSVIQEAVDAAASGDSILVGPGWYEEYRVYSFSTGDAFIYVNKIIPDLTIIGSGSDVTFIGSSKVGAWGIYDPCIGILSAAALVDDGQLRVEGISLNNLPKAIEMTSGSLIATQCIVSFCHRGFDSLSGPIQIRNCEFYDVSDRAIATNIGSHDVDIGNCVFNNCGAGISCGSTPNFSVTNSQFLDCASGGVLWGYSTSGNISGCEILNAMSGFSFADVRDFNFSDNTLNSYHFNLQISQGSNMVFERNIFSGTHDICIDTSTNSLIFHNNHILIESGLAVYLVGFNHAPNVYVDMTNNYWGTDDPDLIASWIHDGNTAPMYGFVNFLPFAQGPLPTERTSWGDLKAMYRGTK